MLKGAKRAVRWISPTRKPKRSSTTPSDPEKKYYGYKDGKVYEFQPDNAGGYHGYPTKGNAVPGKVLQQMRDNGTITDAQLKKLLKGK